MTTIKLPWTMGFVGDIFKRAVEVSEVSGFPCEFEFNALTIIVDKNSVWDELTLKKIIQAIGTDTKLKFY